MHLKISHFKNKLAGLITLIFASVIILSNAAGTITPGGNGGRTGASFDLGTCGDCHSGGTFSSVTVTIQLISGSTVVTSYIPGVTYTVKIRVGATSISTSGTRYGLQAVCVQGSTNNDINNWGTLPATVHSAAWSGRTYIEQSSTLFSGTSPFINIPWTAPASGTGNVVFYAGGCVVNNNSLATGDNGGIGSLTITENTTGCVPAVLTTTVTPVTCNGYGDGSVDLSATGGTGAIGFLWTGPGGFTTTAQSIGGISGGSYTVVVTSAGGCSDTDVVNVFEPAIVSGTVTADTPICPGGTLTFTTTATGGTGPGTYTYVWSGPNSFSSGIPNPSVTGFSTINSGVYTFSLLDGHACSFTTTFDAELAPVPIFSLGPDTTICPPSGSIVLGTVLAGDTYLWSTAVTTPTITVTDSGSYSVTITNSYNCTTSDTVHIGFHCPTIAEHIVANNTISVYPNPASDAITIHSSPDNVLQRICIYNAYGSKVYDKHFDMLTSEHEIDISHFTAGVYSVKVEGSKEQLTKKLMITR